MSGPSAVPAFPPGAPLPPSTSGPPSPGPASPPKAPGGGQSGTAPSPGPPPPSSPAPSPHPPAGRTTPRAPRPPPPRQNARGGANPDPPPLPAPPRHLPPPHLLIRQPQGPRHVALFRLRAARAPLARVVEQQREQQQRRLLHFPQQVPVPAIGLPQIGQRHQRVLIHRVAMVEVPHHQALHACQLRKQRRQNTRLVHPPHRRRPVLQRNHPLQPSPQLPRRRKIFPQRLQPRFQLLRGFRRRLQLVPPRELEHFEHQLRPLLHLVLRPEMHPPPMHREIPVG